ncbi:MAG: nucleoside hydrolase [Melioribacteraceae bacterium]
MKTKKNILILLSLLIFPLNIFAQTKIIFDTDFGGDADDLGALAMLHNFVDKGECELLGIMCWSTEQYAVSAIDAVNRFYKHPSIPIGTRKDSVEYQEWCYSKSIADNFHHKLNQESAKDATVLYRQLLANSKDSSITIVTVGPLKNIENLIKSVGDSISCMTGKELIEKKVKEFVIMGGQFPSGKWEWNFEGGMPGVTKFVIENLNVPIVFSGFEVGVEIKSGEVFNNIERNTPLYVGFLHFSNNAPWMKKFYNGKIIDNATFDQTAVLYAVKNGEGTYWDKVQNGFCKPDDIGGNIWVSGKMSNHSYLKLKMNPEKMAELIEAFMLHRF